MEETDSIIETIQKDRKAGAERLVAEYRDRLYAVAFGLCNNASEAEDLVFRTFEQVLSKIDSYREDEAFLGWMHTILLNYYRMSLRGNVARNTVPAGGPNEMANLSGTIDADTVVSAIDGEILRKTVERLPKELREVVVLHYFMDQPVGKIAKILSIATGTVKSRLYYARLALGMRLGVALRKPAVALIAAGFFIAAAFAATFMVYEHPHLAEVDEPVYLDDAPLAFEDGYQGEGAVVARVAAPCTATADRRIPALPEAEAVLKVSVSRHLKGFQSCSKAVRSKPLSSFNSTAANPVAITVR